MRLKNLLALVSGVVCLGFASAQPASAFFWDRPDQPAGWDSSRVVRHWVYHPRYTHVYLWDSETDPHSYHYHPRGYYPYYNSGYWRHVPLHRNHYTLPPYYAAWGSNKRHYHHVEWHNRHYGGHRRGDW
jgi:hypothetical protein